MFAVEDRHWWFSGKRRLVGALLDRTTIAPAARILDVGCGTGGMHACLRDRGRIFGVDASDLAISFARRRGSATLCRATLPDLPFRDGSFDVVTVFDVLYHRRVEDVERAARECFRVLRPSGVLVVTDSALPWLAGPHDTAMHGSRRFTRSGLRDLLTAVGFVVERASYANFLLFPAAATWRLLQRRSGASHSDVAPAHPAVNRVLGGVYALEAALIRRVDLPIGTSVVAVARRG
jgi:SAM-dependent methyltransferase